LSILSGHLHVEIGYIAGGQPEKETALASPVITKDNAIKYYDETSKF